jgi:serine/threonine-protein kinase
LIDFGGVKQIAVTAAQQLSRQPMPTQLGKRGYTPEEQKQGRAYACSDLYALGVTALVLLTGKDPLDLYDNLSRTWQWRQIVNLSPAFASVLDKMLAERAGDRYRSAQEVLQALEPLASQSTQSSQLTQMGSWAIAHISKATSPLGSAVGNQLSQIKTWALAPARKPISQPVNPKSHPTNHKKPAFPPFSLLLKPVAAVVAVLVKLLFWLTVKPIFYVLKYVFKRLITGGIAVLIFIGILYWLKPQLLAWLGQPNVPQPTCQEQVISRHESLGISAAIFYPQVNEKLYARHPELNGRALTDQPKDAQLRQEWCQIAKGLLDKAEKSR